MFFFSKHKNTAVSACIMLLKYVFSVMVIWYKIIMLLFQEEDYFSNSQHSLVVCNSFSMVETFP